MNTSLKLLALPLFLALLGSGLVASGKARAQAGSSTPAAGKAPAPADGAPQVRVAEVKASPNQQRLRLPARVAAAEEVRVFARASGTVVERRADLGDRVNAGDLLVTIAAPEVDQSLESARAALGQAQARERLAELTLERAKPLVAQQFQSPASLDTLAANLDVARADTAAARAEVRRVEAIQRFQQVRAPFAGVITERAVDRGDRISGEGGAYLFRLAKLTELRVIVDVPQSAALGLRTGTVASVSFPEFGSERFAATLQRRAGAIDPATGSMRVELSLPNADLRLPAGLRGEAAFDVDVPGSVRVPAAALHMRDGRPHVATVDAQSRLRFVPVQVDRTSERDAVLRSGPPAGVRVVLGLNALLREGVLVEVTR